MQQREVEEPAVINEDHQRLDPDRVEDQNKIWSRIQPSYIYLIFYC